MKGLDSTFGMQPHRDRAKTPCRNRSKESKVGYRYKPLSEREQEDMFILMPLIFFDSLFRTHQNALGICVWRSQNLEKLR